MHFYNNKEISSDAFRVENIKECSITRSGIACRALFLVKPEGSKGLEKFIKILYENPNLRKSMGSFVGNW